MKIDFEADTPHGIYRDALHLPDDHTYSDVEIQSMKQQRVDNWIAVVTAPPLEEEVVNSVEIAGETYTRLEGVPPSGAKLIEVNNVWYYKE
jgi:hypothetical protein